MLILLACLPACEGSETPAPVVVDPARPCAFATADEIAAAVGGLSGDRREGSARAPEGAEGARLCLYDVGPPHLTVTLHVQTGMTEESFRDRMERDPLNTDPLEGAGELAFTHGGVAVSVWEDGRAVSASLQDFGEPDETREALKALAELFESKL